MPKLRTIMMILLLTAGFACIPAIALGNASNSSVSFHSSPAGFPRQFQSVSVDGKPAVWQGWNVNDRFFVSVSVLRQLQVSVKPPSAVQKQLELSYGKTNIQIDLKNKTARVNQKTRLNRIPVLTFGTDPVIELKWVCNLLGILLKEAEDRQQVVIQSKTLNPSIRVQGLNPNALIQSDALTFTIIVDNFRLRDYHLYRQNIPGEGHLKLTFLNQSTGKIISRSSYLQQNRISGLSEGNYQLTIQLMNNDQSLIQPVIRTFANFMFKPVSTPRPTPTPVPVTPVPERTAAPATATLKPTVTPAVSESPGASPSAGATPVASASPLASATPDSSAGGAASAVPSAVPSATPAAIQATSAASGSSSIPWMAASNQSSYQISSASDVSGSGSSSYGGYSGSAYSGSGYGYAAGASGGSSASSTETSSSGSGSTSGTDSSSAPSYGGYGGGGYSGGGYGGYGGGGYSGGGYGGYGGGGYGSGNAESQPTTESVMITDGGFSQNVMNLVAGSKLQFINVDSSPLTLTETSRLLQDMDIENNAGMVEITLSKPVTYSITTKTKPNYLLTINVN